MGLDLTGIGSVADFAKGLIDRFWPPAATPEQKQDAALKLQQMLQTRESAVLATQKAVMTAELAQGDTYTKRARPSIVYFGLAAIGLVHVLLPIIAWIGLMIAGKPLADMPKIELPSQFWATWGGVCSIWIIGRSAEKGGVVNRAVSLITGGKP